MRYGKVTINFLIIAGFIGFVDTAAFIQHTLVLKVTVFPRYFIVPSLLGLIFGSIIVLIIYYHAKARDTVKFESLAKKDYLTNTLNRYGVELLFEQEEKRFHRTQKPFSIIMFDIDRFKMINDRYGHKEGDRVLKELTQCVKSELREMDILSRWGGEEFIVLLPEAGTDDIEEISERIRRRVAEYDFKLDMAVTISLGIITATKQCEIHCLIEKADEALYRAKERGRNRVEKASAV